MNTDWWTRPLQDILGELRCDPSGLSSEEARLRQGKSAPIRPARRSVFGLLAAQFFHPLVVLLLVAAMISAAVGSSEDVWIILIVVAASGGLGFYQEYQAETVVQKLMSMVQVSARVRRNGEIVSIQTDQLVPGDVILLSAGALVPGDGRIVRSEALQIDESPLTGEAFPVEKQRVPPAEGRAAAVFLGTHVVSGSGEAVLVCVGQQTELGQLSKQLSKRRPPTEFDLGLQRFGYLLLQVCVVLVLVIFALNVAFDRKPLDSLLFSIALAVGLTPELLPAIVTINLAGGARRMAQAEVILKHLPAIENFGSVDVLCSDKTGTLTEGQVRLRAALALDGAPSARALDLGALNATFESGYANPLDAALRSARGGIGEGWQREGEVAYDFVRKRLSVLLRREGEPKWSLVTKGQLEKVLEICSEAERPDGSIVALASVREQVARLHEQLASEGCRVLGVAVREVEPGAPASRDLEVGMRLVGLLAFADPPKADAASALRDLDRLGVVVKLVTGDDRRVAARLWRELREREPSVMTGAELRAIAGHGLAGRVDNIDVFAEVEPQQKEQIVHALRQAGHVVAYMGDGINDTSALHAADVGISVEGAADVAREAADVVLQRRDLGVIVRGVREGRRTMAKTLVYVRYTTSANFGNMLSMAVASVGLPFLPLMPKQILLNNLLSDIPAMAIPSDHVEDEEIARPRRWSTAEIRRFMFVFGAISSVFDIAIFAALLMLSDGAEKTFQSGWFVESLLTEVVVLFALRTRGGIRSSRPSPLLVSLVLAVALLTIVLPYAPVAPLFSLEPLPLDMLVVVIGVTLLYVAATELAKRWFFRAG